jgi:3-methyladenine DNA glycosylase Tag
LVGISVVEAVMMVPFAKATGMVNGHVADCFRFKELWGD